MADEQEQTAGIAETGTAEAENVGGEADQTIEQDGGAPEAAAPVNENFKWYIIHAYSGFERKVKESLLSPRLRPIIWKTSVGRIEIPSRAGLRAAQRQEVCHRPRLPSRLRLRGNGARQRPLARSQKHPARHRFSADRRPAQRACPKQEVNAMLNRADVTKDKPKMKMKFEKGEQGPHHRRPLRQLQRCRRRSQRRQADPQGHGQHLRPSDAHRGRVLERRKVRRLNLVIVLFSQLR